MTQLTIQFRIRYVSNVNPPDRKEEFSDGLYHFIKDELKLKYIWGSHGGMATDYGILYREEGETNITIADRALIADWIRKQRIDCTATFGDPEPIDSYDMSRDLTELVFEVRNLTDDDHKQAREYRESIQARIKAAGFKKTEPE